MTKTIPRWLLWSAPFLLVLVFSFAPEALGAGPGSVLWSYPLQTLVVGAAIVGLRKQWFVEREPWHFLLGTVVGSAVFAAWVGLEGFYPFLGARSFLNPRAELGGPALFSWLTIRLLGSFAVVAVAEEVFWRGFLYRWIIRHDFESVSARTFDLRAFAVITLLFAAEHDRWLPGLLAGGAYNWIYIRTGSLRAPVLAHAVTNLLLGGYVLATESWHYW